MQLAASVPQFADKIVLLKGAAYVAADFGWADGRTTSDMDVLVDESLLDPLAEALRACGFVTKEGLSEAHCVYFRRWLHELPPLSHRYRRIEIDIHFRLLPKLDPWSFLSHHSLSDP